MPSSSLGRQGVRQLCAGEGQRQGRRLGYRQKALLGFLEVRLTLYLYWIHCAQESPVRDRSTTVTYRGSVFLSDHDAVYCFDSG